ncbi:nuclear receptor subfamily 0 group B member 2-like [Callorhinchus milii]|uniref:Nuclear receptor subfamily 0, group B, member 2b n=1 Tax=Callorhinchus milii TaxID=7868 RepID=A0A4W3K292_CALMI|nr:nuclear receptor subfamily 0 group B member 2-like [Callorhinchus milii]|eukprot:gi/632954753/ref/XP_007893128.1/ PREDICTED: nuclear receptor subfamily 0 group B member 2 [Callorhinchus milii]
MACVNMLLDKCHCASRYGRNAILYNILSQQAVVKPHSQFSHHSCTCQIKRTVCLKTPHITCPTVIEVLVKTVSFMQNLPSFHHLPKEDQLLLLGSCWAPLFLLGLAQEGVNFEVVEIPVQSLLKRLLLNGKELPGVVGAESTQPSIADVQRIKLCLNKFWDLDLTPKEFAYLKGAVLFSADLPGLQATLYVQSLQREAQRVLHEVLVPLQPKDTSRLAPILLTVSALRTISAGVVTELFFRPVIGSTEINQLLIQMFYTKQ